MKKLVLIISALFLISNTAFAADGKLRIKSDMSGASIFIDGKHKGLAKDGQYTDFLLPHGEHKVQVQKRTDEWDYHKKKIVNLASGKALRVNLKLDKSPSKKQQQRIIKQKQRYTDNNNGTVIDKTTGLIWKKCAEGQTWAGSTCSGDASKFSYSEALDNAGDVNFAGHFDWRVPTIKELNTLVFCSNDKQRQFRKNGWFTKKREGGYGCKSDARGDYQHPTINQTLFPNTPANGFWSSSPNSYVSNYAWLLYFNNGYDNINNRNYYYRVRLVRAGE